jgi:hypothetical protein
MVWVQLVNGDLMEVKGSAWQVGKDVYDIMEAPNKSAATLTKANVVGIYKRLPRSLRQEAVAQVVERLEADVDRLLESDLAVADKEEGKRQILAWLQTMKTETAETEDA